MTRNISIIIKALIIIVITNFAISMNLFSETPISDHRIFIKFRSQLDAEKLIPQLRNNYPNSRFLPLLDKEISETYGKSKQNQLQSINYDRKKVLIAEEPLLRTYIMEFDNKIDANSLIRKLSRNYQGIEIAEPSYIYKLQKFTPNDPFFNLQYSLDNILPEDAWEIEKGNPNIVIAISDNGVKQSHPDLINSLFINAGEVPNNKIDDDHNGYIDDYNGFNFLGGQDPQGWGNTYNFKIDHGSIIAGIIGATFNNSKGIAGIAGNCKIYPIKASDTTIYILYPTESIIFAGVHQFSVLNLSWGGVRPYSEIEQNAVDYAIARGVAIVAAGGNTDTAVTPYDTFYPAGCRGVLGVGEVDGDDYIEYNSVMGVPVRIMAPGKGNLGTGNNDNYVNNMGGTSFSAPVISAAVALARSKNPNLNPIQAIEFVRQCTDDIKDKNAGYSDMDLVPGRINLLKVVSTNPMSIPAIVPNAYQYFNTENNLQNRFAKGDTAILKINVTNILGPAINLKFTLHIAYDPMHSVALLDSVVSINSINSMEDRTIGDFKFHITKENISKIIFRLDIKGENNYHDFVKFDFIPTTSYKTFETEQLKFSLGDAGEFGFVYGGSMKLGEGFVVKGYGNQTYGNGAYPSSGIMISNNSERVASFFDVDFKTIKKFVNPDENINIFSDDYANLDRKIGVQVQLEAYNHGKNFYDFKVTIQCIDSMNVKDVSLGYYIDWDVADEPDSNQCEYYADLMTNSITNKFGSGIAGEITYKPGAPIYCAVIAYSDDQGTEAQAAGLDYDYTRLFETNEQIESLNSGISMQSSRIYDRSMVVGMKFKGPIYPNNTKQFHIVFAGDTNRDNLTNTLIPYLLSTDVKDYPGKESERIKYIELPETNELFIQLLDESEVIKEINVYDILGRKMQNTDPNILNQNFAKINLDRSSSQFTIIEIITDNNKYFHKFILN
ncbi:S8 family serine peptidase [bacterium]|nr:S8 family serine peptidase [bacterium]